MSVGNDRYNSSLKEMMKIGLIRLLAFVLLWAAASTLRAQDGETLYETWCASCHESGGESPAASREEMRTLSPEQILIALESGVMSRQGAQRSRAEKHALAEFISDRSFGVEPVHPIPPSAFCKASAVSAPRQVSRAEWSGWGAGLSNTRFQPREAAGISTQDVPRLRLKWAFGLPGATSAGGQPVVHQGRVYVGSWSGDIFSLDASSGCIYWMVEAESAVRSAISFGPCPEGGHALYFGDLAANVYALDAATGRQLWKVKVDDHPLARVTGSPALYKGRLYVPVSSREESQAGNPRYECCRFRGSLVALDVEKGNQLWKSYTVATPAEPTGKNVIGTQQWGPSGAAIWVAPTIDPGRNAIYVGTSNSYSAPATPTSDAIVAFDLSSGKIRWVRQMTEGDVWNGSCPERAADRSNCADTDSPDYDFAASPILVNLKDGRRLLVAAQKSGLVYGLDPDREGKIVWQQRLGEGGTSGGIMWGPAADDEKLYVALSDAARIGLTRVFDPTRGGGMFALDLATGRKLWSTPHPDCGDRKPCSKVQAAAVTVIPGAVFSGSNDGHLRAYSTSDGKIFWDYDTAREFRAVNRVKATGGSINNGGPAIAGGMLFTNSGYSHHTGIMPGNVLLAFAVEP